MKTMMKVLGCGAVLAATAAAHAGTTLPSTDNSNLLFFVNDSTAHTTYTDILTQTVNGTGGYFTTADATSGGTVGTLNKIVGDANFSYNFSGDSALQTFISNAKTAGDNLQWGIIAGAYSGATPSARETTGAALAVGTSMNSTTVVGVPETGVAGSMMTSLNTDVKNLNLKTFDSSNGTTSGIFGTSASAGSTNLNFYGNGIAMSGLALGSGTTLYGMTANGTTSGTGIAYSLGTASFDGTTLTFTGNTVPVPAAAWLLGSGLLGLLGIGRRRSVVAV